MQAFQRQTMHTSWPYDVHFGDDATIPVPMNGDLIDAMLLRLVWPNQNLLKTQSVGTAMINFIELIYESDVIERIYGENLFIQNEISVSQAKRPGLQNLVGIDTTVPLSVYYLHLPFTIRLPLCALSKQPILRVVFSTPDKFMTVPYHGVLELSLVTDYVFLSEPEKQYFMNNQLNYITQSYQLLQFVINPGETKFNIGTSFVNNVKELFWIIQNEDETNMYKYNNDLVNMSLELNGLEFLSNNVANNTYLRVIQPLENHTRTPTSNIYMYSFAMNPEESQPTGEANMTYMYNQLHKFQVLASVHPRFIRIYAHSYNIATIDQGNLTMKHTMYESGFKN